MTLRDLVKYLYPLTTVELYSADTFYFINSYYKIDDIPQRYLDKEIDEISIKDGENTLQILLNN